MDEMAKHPRLMRRGAVYYFRAKVPLDLLGHYAPKREITFSLRTKEPAMALVLVRRESVRVDREFDQARRMRDTPPVSSLSDAEIDRLVDLYVHQELAEDDERRLHGDGDAEFYEQVRASLAAGGVAFQAAFTPAEVARTAGMSEREYVRAGERIAFMQNEGRKALARANVSFVDETVDALLHEAGVRVLPGSQARRKLSLAVLKATVSVADMLAERQRGEAVETPPAPAASGTASAHTSAADALSVIWDRYRAERKLPTKTEGDFGVHVARFIQVNGDLAITEITKAHVRAYKDAMLALPARIPQAMRRMAVPQIIQATASDDTVRRLAVRTVNEKALGAISAVLSYAVQNGYRDDNPAAGIKAAGPVDPEPTRVPYTTDDLQLIFHSPVFASDERPRAGGGEAAKWLPLLALFTGARMEELGRLTTADVREEDGVAYLFVRTGAEGRRVKTRSARRKIPLHSELVRLGFLAYVGTRRGHRSVPLFPDLRSTGTEVTAAFSKWWGRYTHRLGITDPRKVFHSFRHLVKRNLRDAGVDKTLRDALQGHAISDTAEGYGLDEEGIGVSLPVLRDAIERLKYPGLDLSHLVSRTG